MLIGDIYCMAAPRKNGARTLALTAVILVGVSILGQLGGLVLQAISAAGGLAGMAHLFVFLSFLRVTARSIRAHDLANNIKYLTILMAVAFASSILAIIILVVTLGAAMLGAMQGGGAPNVGAGMGAAALLGVGCMCITGIMLLTGFVWYIVVLVRVRSELGYYLER
jgi:hypothetical protein